MNRNKLFKLNGRSYDSNVFTNPYCGAPQGGQAMNLDGLTSEAIGVSEPYPQDHVDMAAFLAGLPLVERLDAMLALHPEFNVDLLDALVRDELIHRFLTRVRG